MLFEVRSYLTVANLQAGFTWGGVYFRKAKNEKERQNAVVT